MYETFFGLGDAPFRLTPDPRYLFLSKKHEDALAHLRLGLTESGFVCITGDVGTGKTTLLRHFLANLGPDVSTAYVFNPSLSALELLQTINAEFGLPASNTSKKALTDLLNAHLLKLRQEARRAVVIIDEAQALDIDVLEQLRLLSNLETPTEKLLRIILVGQPQLRGLLQHPELVQLNQRITLRWHIGPLSAAETSAYVRHRLSVASHAKARDLFTRRALALVHRYSGGVPRLTNMLAHRALLAAFAAERQRVTARDVRKAYREVSTVPLPGARRRSWLVPAIVTATAAGALIAIGARRLAPPPESPAPTVTAPSTGPLLANITADTPQPGENLAAMTTTSTTVPAPSPEQRLTAMDGAATLHGALGAIARAWQKPGPADDDRQEADLARFAERRGLEDLAITGNLAMLRLIDVPAVLELRFPGAPDPRWAALVALEPDRATLAVDGEPVVVEPAFLERYWYGRAHVFSPDFEGLGPGAIAVDARGARVIRLQALLGRTGLYDGGETGLFGPTTRTAVTAFQRSRYIEPDGQVGKLTRMVLYAAVGGYHRPTLVGGGSTS
ncbi:MAG TPA: AAA family ATPase [Candidatus Eisenbacteria bacterium]|nr:AAA family ATPase [Candidatus Eisenbacteria bacterium]